MITPIDLLKIAKERIQVNWEVYCANNEVICDNAKEQYETEIESYSKAIVVLEGEITKAIYKIELAKAQNSERVKRFYRRNKERLSKKKQT